MSEMLKIFSINGIEPLYQPQMNMLTGEVVSVEIFSRLYHPDLGLLYQDDFMPIVNQTGLLELLYIEKLALALEEIHKKGTHINVSIDVNCSLFEHDISDLTKSLCRKYKYNVECITINLINDNSSGISENIISNLNKMKNIGVTLSINALGISTLGLNDYIDIPFDIIKINKTLVTDMMKSFKSREIVKSLINIANTLSLKCIVSGVDNETLWEVLKDMGVFACQGEYISPPIVLEELIGKQDAFLNGLNERAVMLKKFKTVIALNDSFVSYRLRDHLSEVIKSNNFIISHELSDLLVYLDSDDIQSIVIDSGKLEQLLKLNNILEIKNIQKIISLNNDFDGERNYLEHEKITFLDFKHTLIATSKIIANLLTMPADHNINLSILSQQEKIVIEYLMQGNTNKFISARMMLSEKTVSNYKKRALAKLNVDTIVELCRQLS